MFLTLEAFIGVSENATVAFWGCSVGSTASVWASKLQLTYAQGLKMTSAVLGGPAPNIITAISKMNKSALSDLVASSIVAPWLLKMRSDNGLGQATPKIPLYIYKSMGDEFSPVSETDALMNKYRKGGASVQYVRDVFSGHAIQAVTGALKALFWLIDILDGEKPRRGCSTSTVVSSLLDPNTGDHP